MKDYAKPQNSSNKNKRSIKPWLTTIIILVAIALPLAMFLVHFKKSSHQQQQKTASVIPIPKHTATKKNKPKNNKQEFDFYNLLSKT